MRSSTAPRSRSMPRSTLSAVRTPGNERPSSTSVIATAGCMPTTTVTASSTRAIPAMLASMRPMNESTTSSELMSISTPRAPVREIRSVRSSWRVSASWSCMSTWIVTRRNAPILRIGIRSSTSGLRLAARHGRATDGQIEPLERRREGVGQRRLGGDVAQLDAQMHDGLGDLRANAADDAVGAHEARRGHRLEQVLRGEGVDGRDAGDVEDRHLGPGLDDALEERLHDDLGPGAVERADHGQRENALPQLHHGGGELQHILLLAEDDLFPALLIDLGREQPQAVEQLVGPADLLEELARVLAQVVTDAAEQRRLEREHERGRLRRTEALDTSAARDAGQHVPHGRPVLAPGHLLEPAVL